jgi:hypothetical protein
MFEHRLRYLDARPVAPKACEALEEPVLLVRLDFKN